MLTIISWPIRVAESPALALCKLIGPAITLEPQWAEPFQPGMRQASLSEAKALPGIGLLTVRDGNFLTLLGLIS